MEIDDAFVCQPIDACDYCDLGQDGRCHEVSRNCPISQANGDEEAGESNFRNSYERTKAVHSRFYASVGDAEWDAMVLANEVDRLNRLRALKGES